MAKKMTLKEFKEALLEGGMDLDIWGYEGILNELVIAQRHIADASEELGCKNIAECRRRNAAKMVAILDSRNYYES